MIPNRPFYFAIALALLAAVNAPAQDRTFPPPYAENIFPIMGWWGPPFDYKEYDRYYKAGFTVGPVPPRTSWNDIITDFAKLDMVAMYTLPEPRKLSPKSFLEFAQKWDSSYGWILKDEATPADVPNMLEEIRTLHDLEPGLKTMAILDARDGMKQWSEALPKLFEAGLSIACMQSFHLPDTTETDEQGFFKSINTAQQHAAAHDAEVWAMIQVTPFDGHRRASESDIRLQSYTALALGARGLVHYAYWDPPYTGRYEEWGPAMIDPKTRVGSYGYEMTFYVNREVRRLATHFVNLDYAGHYYVGEKFAGAPEAPMADSPIKRIIAPKALVGEFRSDDENEAWALIVNRRHGHFSAAVSTPATIQVLVHENVVAVHEVDRQNGYIKNIPLEPDRFNITTPGGTGNLIRFTLKED